jgi:hypothetical protein
MKVLHRIIIIALAGVIATMALAQAPANVKVANETKNAFGTVTEMNVYNFACYIGFTDDQGADFTESAELGFCKDPDKFDSKRYALTYKLSKIQAESCQGDPKCTKTDTVPLIVGMKQEGKAVQPIKKAAPPGRASFCLPTEVTVFACRTGKKMVSVCAGKDSTKTTGMLQYRFGMPDSSEPLEMMWPESRLAPSKVATGATVPFAGGGGVWLRIAKGDHAYVVYDGIGKWGPQGQTRTKSGLTVERKGKAIAHLKCNMDATSELGPDWFEKNGVTDNNQEFDFPD